MKQVIIAGSHPSVTWCDYDNKRYYFLYLNEVPVEIDGKDCIQYDFKEICDPYKEIDQDDIMEYPENYLNWGEDTTPTLQDLIDAVNALTDLVIGGIE